MVMIKTREKKGFLVGGNPVTLLRGLLGAVQKRKTEEKNREKRVREQ